MRKLILPFLILISFFQFTSCDDNKPQTQKDRVTLINGVTDMRFSCDGGQNTIRFVANGDWQFEIYSDSQVENKSDLQIESKSDLQIESKSDLLVGNKGSWLTTDKTKGSAGTFLITFTAAKNDGTESRKASGCISCGEAKLEISAVQGGKSEDGPALDTIRVMQFNILQSTSEKAGHEWSTVRRQPCVAMFRDIEPDIVCCQESRKTQCNDLASDLPAYSQIKHPKDNIESNGGQRNLILYKTADWTLVGWDKLWFSSDRTSNDNPPYGDSKTTQKLLMYAHLKHNLSNKDLWVFNAHYFASCENASLRDSCVAITIQTIKKNVPEDVACIFCGDLNINYNDDASRGILNPLMSYMDCASLKAATGDAAGTTTYNAFNPSYTKVLDYVFYKNMRGLKYKVVNSKDYGTEYISDHYPLYVDIEF